MVRAAIRQTLTHWFTKVLHHGNAAAGRPKGYGSLPAVQWTTSLSASQVGLYDIVVYFSPRPGTTQPGSPTLPTVHDGDYLTAAKQLSDPNDRKLMLMAIGNTAGAAGHTVRGFQGNAMFPILSELFVLYDRQFSLLQSRVDKNAEEWAVAAFHEAGHNKADDLHTQGGGGIFSMLYQGQKLNAANIAFMASNIWTWGPQYVIGQSLSPVNPP